MMMVYKCNLCNNLIKKLYNNNNEVAGFLQCSCGGVMEKQMPNISTSSIEMVDNGAMAKRVELRKDAVQRMKERQDTYIKTIEERDRVLKKDDSNN